MFLRDIRKGGREELETVQGKLYGLIAGARGKEALGKKVDQRKLGSAPHPAARSVRTWE